MGAVHDRRDAMAKAAVPTLELSKVKDMDSQDFKEPRGTPISLAYSEQRIQGKCVRLELEMTMRHVVRYLLFCPTLSLGFLGIWSGDKALH